MEPADNRQLPSRLRAPGSGQACRKTLGFALIPNCELKFGPAHNAPGTWRHKGVDATPRPHPPASPVPPPARRRPVSGAAGLPGASVPTGVSSSNLQGPGAHRDLAFLPQPWRLGLWGRRVHPRQGRRMGFIREREVTSCSPSFLRPAAEEAGLNYREGLRFHTKGFLPGRGWEA